MSSPTKTTLPLLATFASHSLPPLATVAGHRRLTKAVKEFDQTKAGVKNRNDSGIQTIPPFFVHPPEILSDLTPRPETESQPEPEIPTIDLSDVHASRSAVVDQIHHAASTVGFFQVINHGVSPDLLRRTVAACKAFHEQRAEARGQVYHRMMGKGVAHISNVDLFQSKAASWHDTLQVNLGAIPVAADEGEIPEVCRKEVIEWDKEMVRVGEVLFGLLSEGLGLGAGRLTEMGMAEARIFLGHYYPFCPQPHLTVGLNSHPDPAALTVLLQDHIGGLQVRTEQGWINVKPREGALVINIGDLLQIISNEEYKSVDHRVLANSSNEPRVSVAVYLNPGVMEKLFGPLPELTSAEKPALYRNFSLREFFTILYTEVLDGNSVANYFRQ